MMPEELIRDHHRAVFGSSRGQCTVTTVRDSPTSGTIYSFELDPISNPLGRRGLEYFARLSKVCPLLTE